MKKSFFNFDILAKSVKSLKFLDNSSKKLIKILGLQFFFGSLIESFSLTLIYKLFNLIFYSYGTSDSSQKLASGITNTSLLQFIDIKIFILFTIVFIFLSGLVRTYILRRIYKNAAIIAHKLSCRQIMIFNKLNYDEAREVEPSKWLTHNQFIYTYTSSILQPLLQIFSSFILGITILVTILFLYKIYFISILFITIIIYFFITLIYNEKLTDSSFRVKKYTPESFFYQNIIIEAIQEIRIYDWSNYIFEKFKNADLEIKDANANRVIISNTPRIIVETTILIVVMIISLYAIAEGNISELAITLLGIQKLLPNIQQIYVSLSTMKANTHVIESIRYPSFLKKIEIKKQEKINKSIIKQEIFNKYNLESSKNFYYIKANNLVNNFSNNSLIYPSQILFPKNNWTSITGKTGSGKSTLIEMLVGLLSPDNGSIEIPKLGKINSKLKLSDWQSQITYMPQFGFLVNQTIIENIIFPNKNYNNEDLIDLMRLLEIDEKNGFTSINDGLIGINGKNLSGGQRQKIRLARAFYSNKDYIFLDEPSNGLDAKSEKRIFTKLKEKSFKKTVIFITHSEFMKGLSDVNINLSNDNKN